MSSQNGSATSSEAMDAHAPAITDAASSPCGAPQLGGDPTEQGDFTARYEAFIDIWKPFMRSKGLNVRMPQPGLGNFNLLKFFTCVLQAGGSANVSKQKLWAQIGRTMDPPSSMTDLSHKMKTIFQNKLYPLEQAYAAGQINLNGIILESSLPVPEKVMPGMSTPSHTQSSSLAPPASESRPKNHVVRGNANKTGATSMLPPPPPAARARKAGPPAPTPNKIDGRPPKRRAAVAALASLTSRRAGVDSERLIGSRVGVYWPVEQRYFFGRVTSYSHSEKLHCIQYDDGDEESVDFNKEVWVLVDDDNKQMPEKRLKEAKRKTNQLDNMPAVGEEDVPMNAIDEEEEDVGEVEEEENEEEGGKQRAVPTAGACRARRAPLVVGGPACIHPKTGVSEPRNAAETESESLGQGKRHFVYRTTSGTPGFEIYCMLPGYRADEIAVKAFSRGLVQLKAGGQWKPTIVEAVELPSKIDNHSAQALYTEAGQLYVRVAASAEPTVTA